MASKVRYQHLSVEGDMTISDIYTGIQTDGTPSIFVVLSGCNLECPFCNVDYSSAFLIQGSLMTVERILGCIDLLHLDAPGCTNIVLTGGEPFRQNFVPLAARLLALGFTVEIETNGTLWIDDFANLAQHCRVTVSPHTETIDDHIERCAAAYKYMVSAENSHDGDCIRPIGIDGKMLPRPRFGAPIYVQPICCEHERHRADNYKAALRLAQMTGWKFLK